MPSSKHWILIILGSLIWSLTMIKSGLVYKYGMGFWGPNGHDGIWHISLISSLNRGSFHMPIFAGSVIQNYHLGFDILAAGLVSLTHIPVQTLYFQILPPLMALLIGYLVYTLTKSSWSVFFVYFGGSFGWLVSWVRHGNWGGESMFWSQQAISTLINPPFALSIIFLLLGLISLEKRNYLWATIFFGLTSSIKVYAGILALSGLALASIFRRDFIKVFLGSALISLVLFIPFNLTASKLLIFQPGWFLETMMGLSDRLNWPKFYSAMTNYRLSGNYFKTVLAYLVAFTVFVIGNLGTRLIAFFHPLRFKITWKELFMYQAIILGTLFPMLFLQSGTPWNTIQFFYYTQFFASLLAGIVVTNLTINNQGLKTVVIVVLILLTIPTTIDAGNHYLPARPPAMIPSSELQALTFLSKQPQGTVLTPVFDSGAASAAQSHPPRPLYLYESTAYVSAFTNHPTFLEDEVNLNITNFPWARRRSEIEHFFSTTDLAIAQQFLSANKIEYIYLPQVSVVRPKLSDQQLGFVNIYENSTSAIWARKH